MYTHKNQDVIQCFVLAAGQSEPYFFRLVSVVEVHLQKAALGRREQI